MDGGGSAWVRASDSEMVGAPLLDGFLDFFGRKLFVESSGGEGREFVVGGEAEGDQLGFGEFGDAGTESGVEQGGKTEALFEADDVVLDFEGIETNFENGDRGGEGGEDEEGGVESGETNEMDDGGKQDDGKCGQDEEVEEGIEALVVGEILRRGVGHGEAPLETGDMIACLGARGHLGVDFRWHDWRGVVGDGVAVRVQSFAQGWRSNKTMGQILN